MAYEVARVHGLIMSNIQDGEGAPAKKGAGEMATKAAAGSGMVVMPPRTASPDSPFLHDFPAELLNWSSESSLSSPESSTEAETESDDEGDYAGLAEQIAHSMLDDDADADDSNAPDASTDLRLARGGGRVNAVSSKVAVSPQSNWSSHGSAAASWSDSVSSSKQSSQVSSPPSTPSTSESDAWDLLNAAAGEVVRIRRSEEKQHQQGSFPAAAMATPEAALQGGRAGSTMPAMPVPAPAPWRSSPTPVVQLSSATSCNAGARLTASVPASKYRLSGERLQVHKGWIRPKDESRVACNVGLAQQKAPRNDGAASWNHRQNRPVHHRANANSKAGRQQQQQQQQNYGFSGHQQQQQHHHHPRVAGRSVECGGGAPQRAGAQVVNGGSGMRAVFLGSAGSGRESGGTGVFLPRSIGGGSEQRRKPACSTVLLPSRIVQVLNLNVEDMRSHPAAPLSTMGTTHNRGDLTGTLRTPAPTPPHMYMMDLSSGVPKFGDGLSTRKAPGPRVRASEPIELSLPTEWTY